MSEVSELDHCVFAVGQHEANASYKSLIIGIFSVAYSLQRALDAIR